MPSQGPFVLVADDHPLIGWALRQALEPLGFDVSVAATRAEVCGRLFSQRYTHVVMSDRIGNATMCDVLCELASFQPLTRLIVLTEPGTTEQAIQSVPTAQVFEKPFNVADLATALQGAVPSDGDAVEVPA
jgi:DNA-binding NtrC family response regulator